MGFLTVVLAADLASAAHTINVAGSGRVGDTGVGKRKGAMCLRDNGSSDYDLAVAIGDGATSPWIIFGRESTVTPS